MAQSTRDAYGHVLEAEIYKNPDVVVVDADIASSTRAEKFKNKAPERFFNVGISEQDLLVRQPVWPPSARSLWPARTPSLQNGVLKLHVIPFACPT